MSMRRYYHRNAPLLAFTPPYVLLFALGGVFSFTGFFLLLASYALVWASEDVPIISEFAKQVGRLGIIPLVLGIVTVIAGIVVRVRLPDRCRIRFMVMRRLFSPEYGNPLGFREGELLPRVRCVCLKPGIFELTIAADVCNFESLLNMRAFISSSLRKQFSGYAVTFSGGSDTFNEVEYTIMDVTRDKSLTAHSSHDLCSGDSTKLRVDEDTVIDLTTSGSMLVAGKTRSGKTTGIISLLLPVLRYGRDKYGSSVVIIDPKRAELSRLPHVVTVDDDGGARAILEAVRQFASSIVTRQSLLNSLSEKRGDAVKWWDAGFLPSFLFLDEFVALRTLFPKKAAKDDESYCLAEFDALLKRIVTMGASAGCFVIVSIAEASVEEGGLPSMLRSAMSTRILFKPTVREARLMWDSTKIENVATSGRAYGAGDAWFSSSDGVHDDVSFVHFPHMKFPVYGELGDLLRRYYAEDTTPPCEAEGGAVSVPD